MDWRQLQFIAVCGPFAYSSCYLFVYYITSRYQSNCLRQHLKTDRLAFDLRSSTSSTFDHAKCQGTDWFYRRDRRLIEAHLYYLNLVQRSHCTESKLFRQSISLFESLTIHDETKEGYSHPDFVLRAQWRFRVSSGKAIHNQVPVHYV